MSESPKKTPAHASAPLLLGCGVLAVPAIDAVLWLGWTERGLAHLLWAETAAARPAELVGAPEAAIPEPYAGVLQAYLAGAPVNPVTLPVDLRGTDFQLRVWQALRQVPRGAVRSYVGIANDVGQPRAMRAVGMANASNPVAIVVPCHRVIAKGAGIGGYTPGLRFKRFLLALEGVDVVADRVSAGQLALI